MPDTALLDSLIESLTQALGQENVLTDSMSNALDPGKKLFFSCTGIGRTF